MKFYTEPGSSEFGGLRCSLCNRMAFGAKLLGLRCSYCNGIGKGAGFSAIMGLFRCIPLH